MRRIGGLVLALAGAALLASLLVLPALSQEGFKPPRPADKELCARMIRSGDEAYSRGKYLDAKKYYRMAIAADPTSATAWSLYDRAFLEDLAHQVERTGKYIPYVPQGDLEQMVAPSPPPVPTATSPTPSGTGAPAPVAPTTPPTTPAPGGRTFDAPQDRPPSFIREGC